jgi:hypothetical protein
MATAPTDITRGPRCPWQSAPSETAPPECRVTHASAPKRQASASSRWAQDALSDRQAYVVSALRPSRRKRGHADDVRVAAQHQCVGDDGGDPSPCSDLTGVEPGTAGSNRRVFSVSTVAGTVPILPRVSSPANASATIRDAKRLGVGRERSPGLTRPTRATSKGQAVAVA